MKINKVGEGKVVLIAGGGKCYTDRAARFCHSEKDLEDIIASPYNKQIVKNILSSGHLAATEFDNYIFGVEGYARVTEIQLVRKRLASYLIKSGRDNKNGKRKFEVTLPESIMNISTSVNLDPNRITLENDIQSLTLLQILSNLPGGNGIINQFNFTYELNTIDILDIIENWYSTGVEQGAAEEDLRYMKPQATSFKAIISMNKHALHDWFMIRLCKNAQTEIRDLAQKMFKLCREVSPDLFEGDGPSCKVLGYCPENARQHKDCVGKVFTKTQALHILADARRIDYLFNQALPATNPNIMPGSDHADYRGSDKIYGDITKIPNISNDGYDNTIQKDDILNNINQIMGEKHDS